MKEEWLHSMSVCLGLGMQIMPSEIKALIDEVVKLREEIELWKFKEKELLGARSNLFASLRETLCEVDRLQKGDFTEEEFQNLCHNFDQSDACRFRKGCDQYFKKLFGYDPPATEIKENEDGKR